MTALVAARILNGEGGASASPAWLVMADRRIVATGTGAPPADATDLGDALVVPGFVDIQVNGAGSVDFATASVDEIIATVDERVAGGCTACVPTICTAPLDTYVAMLERFAAVRAARPDAVIGVHLEGPFLGGAPGAHPRELVRPVDLDWLAGLCDRFGDLLRLVTLAPEADPGLRATAMLRARGVMVALGHSTVSYEGALEAADNGAGLVTHLFNGMGALHHRAPVWPARHWTIGASFRRSSPTVCTCIRCCSDWRFVARPDAVLVTDAVATIAPIEDRDGAAYLPDGTLAGSTLTMLDAVQRVVALGIATAAAVRAATGNPARAIGASDYGRIAPGARADLLALDPETLAVRAVWTGGRLVGRPVSRT